MIRKARISDVKDIQKLIAQYAKQDLMLPRSLNELYENIRDYFVSETDGCIHGCAGLHVSWEDLAEIKSLAVSKQEQGKDIAQKLLAAALDEAKSLDIGRVFALTYIPEFFKKYGFKVIDKSELPHKIWSECIHCVKFPDCDETPLLIKLW